MRGQLQDAAEGLLRIVLNPDLLQRGQMLAHPAVRDRGQVCSGLAAAAAAAALRLKPGLRILFLQPAGVVDLEDFLQQPGRFGAGKRACACAAAQTDELGGHLFQRMMALRHVNHQTAVYLVQTDELLEKGVELRAVERQHVRLERGDDFVRIGQHGLHRQSDDLAVFARVLQRVYEDRAEEGEAVRPLRMAEIMIEILEDKGPQLGDDELPVAEGVADLVEQVLQPGGQSLIAGHGLPQRGVAGRDCNGAGGLLEVGFKSFGDDGRRLGGHDWPLFIQIVRFGDEIFLLSPAQIVFLL